MTCVICGFESSSRLDVALSLAHWSEPLAGRIYDAVPRCRDRAACRARCEAAGDLWPIDGHQPKPSEPAEPTNEAAALRLPLVTSAPLAAQDEEAARWE